MPKSKHRKNQKQKAKQKTLRVKSQQKKAFEQYMEMLKKVQEEQEVSGVTPPPNPYDLNNK
jgi:16S rRNA G527 N7-methylase RsmG